MDSSIDQFAMHDVMSKFMGYAGTDSMDLGLIRDITVVEIDATDRFLQWHNIQNSNSGSFHG